MKNLAITLGVSEYRNAEDLSACKNDVELMNRLLCATGKYELLQLDGTLSGTQMVEQIEKFLTEEASGRDVGEVFFYFSGHGFQDDEAHFILRDTALDRINSTALNNSEIDELVRRCNPRLFVKVIDACQSGLAYIKALTVGSEGLDLALPATAKALENCIFMCSSKKDQYSMATKEYSLFTRAFVSAVLEAAENGAEVIRYSDIQNSITDAFRAQGSQTPYFITQSDGRDIFTEMTPELKRLAASLTESEQEQQSDENCEWETEIERFLQAYREEADVQAIMERIRTLMEEQKPEFDRLQKYYECRMQHTGYADYREDKGIVNFLYKRRDSENLYVKFDTERVRSEGIISVFPSFETKPTRYSSFARGLPSAYCYHLEPNRPGLPEYEVLFVFVYSDAYFYVFHATKQFVRKGWKEFVCHGMTSYNYKKVEYAAFEDSEWKAYVNKQLQDSVEYIEKTLLAFVANS